MKNTIQHPVYGQILYEESIWTGKKVITVNGTALQKVSKDTYVLTIAGESVYAVLKGSLLSGACLTIRDEAIWLVAKPAWYDWLLSVLPFVVMIIWGNSPQLCSIIPVVGGAIGGAIGGVGFVTTMVLVRDRTGFKKILAGLLSLVVTFAVGAALGYGIVFAFLA